MPAKATEFTVKDLKWKPQKSGETKLTLQVKEMPGELVKSNNTFSTFVTVLGGGLNVLYLAGPYGVWEQRFLLRALDPSQRVQVNFKGLREPARPDMDSEFAKGAYDVYILGDLPAEFLTTDADGRSCRDRVVQDGSALHDARRPRLELRRRATGPVTRDRRHPAHEDP